MESLQGSALFPDETPVPALQQPRPANRQIYYQMSTSNKSFLEMHYFLKSQDIKNNRFMLALFDPDLAGVDPYDPMLSTQMKIKILKEVQINYWYFLREVVRVTANGHPKGVPYQLNRGNLAYNFCAMYNLNLFFEMPRQIGKTMAANVRYLYIYNFASTNSNIIFMNKNNQDSKRNLESFKAIRDLLPTYLQLSQEFSMVNGKKKRLPSTVTNIQHPINHNIIRTVPGARNETAAANLLRGQTVTLWWADEWAFTAYNQTIMINSMPALTKAFENAKAAGVPHGITITTTAGILSSHEGQFAFDMINNATPFSERWYDLTYDQIMNIVSSNMNSVFVYIKYNYRQLGLGEEWFYNQCKSMLWKMVDIRREILLEWIDTPENSPFSQDDLEALRGMLHEPIRSLLILNKYSFNIYDTVPVSVTGIPINPPIIGVDVSGGYKRDYTAISVIDSATTKFIGGIKCNYMSIPDLARVLIWLVKTMMPNAVVNIERNGGFGASLISKLKEPGGIKENLYYEIKDRIIEETSDSLGRPIRRKQRTKVYGLDSSKDVRDLLIEILRERMERHKDKIYSPVMFDELSKMVVKRNGKVEHSDNSHDDLVFSYLMALYVWYEGKNLKENFGINKSTIKTEDSVDDSVGRELEERYTEIVEELKLPPEEQSESLRQMNDQLKMMKMGMGMMFNEFVQKQRANEQQMLMDMLQNKAVREAYSKATQIPVSELEGMTKSNKFRVPDSVFTSFGEDPEERIQKEIAKNMNFQNFDTGEYSGHMRGE